MSTCSSKSPQLPVSWCKGLFKCENARFWKKSPSLSLVINFDIYGCLCGFYEININSRGNKCNVHLKFKTYRLRMSVVLPAICGMNFMSVWSVLQKVHLPCFHTWLVMSTNRFQVVLTSLPSKVTLMIDSWGDSIHPRCCATEQPKGGVLSATEEY